MIAGNAAQKYGVKLDEQQQVLLSLADILVEIYFAESALLRTLKNIKREGLDSHEVHVAMVQYYFIETQSLILKCGKETILHISKDKERDMLLNALNKNCDYINHPDSFELKTIIADKLIKENSYCF